MLVIVDDATRAIGEALRAEAHAAGADAVLAVMDERATDGTDPARPIAGALIGAMSTSRQHPLDQSYARAQAGHRRRDPRGDDARCHRGHARACMAVDFD